MHVDDLIDVLKVDLADFRVRLEGSRAGQFRDQRIKENLGKLIALLDIPDNDTDNLPKD